jgi:hypothetical protein
MLTQSRFEQRILHKALSQKFDESAKFVEILQNIPENAAYFKATFKNVCVKIDQSLTERLESTLSLLDMTKGEFLQMAIVEALDKADVIIEELDLNGHFKEVRAMEDAIQAEYDAKEGVQ